MNALTSQRLTDLAGGSTFYDNRIDVRAAEQPNGQDAAVRLPGNPPPA